MKKLISALLVTTMLVQPLTIYAEAVMTNSTATISSKTTNIVKFEPTEVEVNVVTANNSVVDDVNVKNMISTTNVQSAINGGFFNSYYDSGSAMSFPDNCAKVYATLIQDGKLINGGGTAIAMIGFDSLGNPVVDKVNIKSQVSFIDQDILIWGVNNSYSGSPTMYFTEEMTVPVTTSSDYTNIFIVNSKVTKIINGGTFTVAKNESVLAVPTSIIEKNEGFGKYINVGDTAEFNYTIEPINTDESRWENITQAMGGGALLVANGVNVANDNTYSDSKQAANVVVQRSFIGVTNNGQIIMGEGVASFNDVADYLVKNGVKEAMALDGGASSMLYSNGTYLQTAGRELASILTFNKVDSSDKKATKTGSQILIDGKQVDLPAYTIESTTYFKLRDLAYYLSDTDVSFNVGYDSAKSAVVVNSGEAYNKDNHIFTVNSDVASAKKATYPTYINDIRYDFTAYVIGGNTHYKLRDIGDALGFEVTWNTQLEQIEIKTK